MGGFPRGIWLTLFVVAIGWAGGVRVHPQFIPKPHTNVGLYFKQLNHAKKLIVTVKSEDSVVHFMRGSVDAASNDVIKATDKMRASLGKQNLAQAGFNQDQAAAKKNTRYQGVKLQQMNFSNG